MTGDVCAVAVWGCCGGVGWQIPVMVQSAYCHLKNKTDRAKRELGECPYDQVVCCHWSVMMRRWCRPSVSLGVVRGGSH